MGEPLSLNEVKTAVFNSLCCIRTYSSTYESLFMSAEYVAKMNEVAPAFFQQYQVLLLDGLILEMSKLYDPLRNRFNEESIGFPLLLDRLGSLDSGLVVELESCKLEAKQLLRVRNKSIAHRDVSAYISGVTTSWAKIQTCIENSEGFFRKCFTTEGFKFTGDIYPAKQLMLLLRRTSI